MYYSAKVLEYFLNPRHAGEMECPDGVGRVGDIACGDCFAMYVRVRDGRLAEVKYQVLGCPAAIATCEATAEVAVGKTLEEVQWLTEESVAESVGGLPEAKLHCSNSAVEALSRALADYLERSTRKRSANGKEVKTDATR
jgi:nitrogen fixation NifU-like protein